MTRNRYEPAAGDQLVDSRGRRGEVLDVQGTEVVYERPQGGTVRTLVTSLRRDLLRGTYTVEAQR